MGLWLSSVMGMIRFGQAARGNALLGRVWHLGPRPQGTRRTPRWRSSTPSEKLPEANQAGWDVPCVSSAQAFPDPLDLVPAMITSKTARRAVRVKLDDNV
jgi:hypothetical protein